MKEVFKNIPNYEGLYQVSNLGRVKSLSRKNSKKCIILKPFMTGLKKRNYKTFGLYKKKIKKQFKASQLVAMAFLNHKPDGYKLVVDHIDNNSHNDNLKNLQIITPRENTSKDKKNCTSKFTGVTWNKNANKWKAYYKIKDKQIHLGYFKKEVDALNSYNKFTKDKLKLI